MQKLFMVLACVLIWPCFSGAGLMSQSRSNPPKTYEGLASWYGTSEQGRRMANGARFDRHSFTAASRTLPFGTRLLVVNKRNGKGVEVTVTDRGPGSHRRALDLAEAAAKSIDCVREGVCKVRYTVIPEEG